MTAPPVQATAQFRQALGAFATGVTIVTTQTADGRDVGLTANSFNSVSLDPPMVLWSLARNSLSLPHFLSAEFFAVHVLASNQEPLSNVFAAKGADKFAGLGIQRGQGQVPLLDGCAARFQCRTAYRYEGGDHVIFVGEVVEFDRSDRPPLVFHGGNYAISARKPSAQPREGRRHGETDNSFNRDFLIYLLGRAHHQQFLKLQSELERHGLAETDWYVLTLLGSEDRQTVAALDAQLAYTGTEVTYDQMAGLALADFVQLHGPHDPEASVTLTPKGRQALIELVAAAKAAEADAERSLGQDETRLLKIWLRRIIDATAPGPMHRRRADD